MAESSDGVIGYFADRHGRPSSQGNEHLTAEQRKMLTQQAEAVALRRGPLQAVVVVDVYENGEAVPQVQLPKSSTIDMADPSQVNEAVARAAEALENWS